MKTNVILTDIEGTTSSISFVKDVLFPYSSQHLESFIQANKTNPEIQKLLFEVLNFKDNLDKNTLNSEQQSLDIERSIEILRNWIKLDLKLKPLKDLQGLIWEEGYRKGDFHGHIYADAYENLKEWYSKGIPLYIYSSGSIYAQKLLFGHTQYGDLNYLFVGNFDTNIGGKKETKSYNNIVKAIKIQNPNINTHEILFLSDIEAELSAASDAGLRVLQLVREDSFINKGPFKRVRNFNEINLD